MDVRQTAQRILEAGKSAELSASLLAIAEMTVPGGELKYPPRTCRELARIVVCRNYAKSVLQLCHLINAADACARRNESYERLMIGVPLATPRNFRDHLSVMLSGQGWRRPGFTVEPAGIAIAYGGGAGFRVSFSRMPLLAALLEFVIGMQGYAATDDIFAEMLAGSANEVAIGEAANALSRRIYAYLSDHLPTVQNMGKFNRILEFLGERSEGGEVEIGDPAILDFWLKQPSAAPSDEGGLRTFRGVLDAFIAFIRSLELAADRQGALNAAPIGGDAESGEIDPDSLAGLMDAPGQWRSPLPLLEDDPAARVKFLTSREKEALRLLMKMGPMARSLPMSLLRAEIFGPAQSRLTQALRRRATSNELRTLLRLDDIADYGAQSEQMRKLQRRIGKAMLASLHVLLRDRDIAASGNIGTLRAEDPAALFETISQDPAPPPLAGAERVMDEAARAFRDISRKGFSDEAIEEPPVMEAFRCGAGVMQAISRETEGFLDTISRLDGDSPDLAGWFHRDREKFRNQFKRLYGVRS
ncbi:MAG: hypothetical protein KAR37_16340 [Alphaproteobacteria bacterium]|nr:hypothetical protein [Alphaproteobacteria bacterium]